MISIITYGRNDLRGYGMHKRVALSINTMAKMIGEGTGEIIFVDYNTPDHLPTLPELLRNEFTPQALICLRVLRVRPDVHQRFSDLTPLPVLEPVARNVALRRTRAYNPWILSTNTDSILIPKSDVSIDAILNDATAGHFVLPRFDLPERVWETFDQRDPDATINATRRWSEAGRLDEAVYGEGAAFFDCPGDFQLARRSDMFAIDGFNEEMLLGWHVDLNLARRLQLQQGKPKSLSDQLSLYHCGHARLSSGTHAHDRIENDSTRFVDAVGVADLPHQRDLWGCPDDDIEEIDLFDPTADKLHVAYTAAIEPANDTILSTTFSSETFNSASFDDGHVAAHVLDLLSTYRRGTSFAYFGLNADFLVTLLKGLSALGFQRKILIPEEMGMGMAIAGRSDIRSTHIDRIVEWANAFIVDFGWQNQKRDVGGNERRTSEATELEAVSDSFRLAVEAEQHAIEQGKPSRLFVAVNCINTRFQPLVESTLAAAPSPFTSRLRYGFLPAVETLTNAAPELAKRIGRDEPISVTEMIACRSGLALLARGIPSEAERLDIASNQKLIMALAADDQALARFGASRDEIVERLEACGQPAADISHLSVLTSDESVQGPAASGMARLSDWDNAEWRAFAQKQGKLNAHRSVLRNGWIWERAQLCWSISRWLGGKSGGRLLLVSESPDTVSVDLSRMFQQTDLVDIRQVFGHAKAELTRLADFDPSFSLSGASCSIVSFDQTKPELYDALVLLHSSAFREGVSEFANIVCRLRPYLKTGGVFAFTGEVSLLGVGREVRPNIKTAGLDGLPALLARAAGLSIQTPFAGRIARPDAALVGTPDDLDARRPVLGLRREHDVFWPAVWVFTANDMGAEPDMEDMKSTLQDAIMLGELIPVLHVSSLGKRKGNEIHALTGQGFGHVFFGPFLELPAASYEVRIDLQITDRRSPPFDLTSEVALGDIFLEQKDVEEVNKDGTSALILEFSILQGQLDQHPDSRVEIRFWTAGLVECVIRSVTLSRNADI